MITWCYIYRFLPIRPLISNFLADRLSLSRAHAHTLSRRLREQGKTPDVPRNFELEMWNLGLYNTSQDKTLSSTFARTGISNTR